jgi:hypothetical protein
MRAEETFHFAKECRSIGAFSGNQVVAGWTGRQFNCPGEHVFGAGGGLFHRARRPRIDFNIRPGLGQRKNN